jgi:type II secretory pathway component PulK
MKNDQLKRRGSLIVAVLVVLFLIVLMSTQTLQTLIFIRQADSRQHATHQARELVELGKMICRQHPRNVDSSAKKIHLNGRLVGQITIETQLLEDQLVKNQDASPLKQRRYLITASVSTESGNTVATATWEGTI